MTTPREHEINKAMQLLEKHQAGKHDQSSHGGAGAAGGGAMVTAKKQVVAKPAKKSPVAVSKKPNAAVEKGRQKLEEAKAFVKRNKTKIIAGAVIVGVSALAIAGGVAASKNPKIRAAALDTAKKLSDNAKKLQTRAAQSRVGQATTAGVKKVGAAAAAAGQRVADTPAARKVREGAARVGAAADKVADKAANKIYDAAEAVDRGTARVRQGATTAATAAADAGASLARTGGRAVQRGGQAATFAAGEGARRAGAAVSGAAQRVANTPAAKRVSGAVSGAAQRVANTPAAKKVSNAVSAAGTSVRNAVEVGQHNVSRNLNMNRERTRQRLATYVQRSLVAKAASAENADDGMQQLHELLQLATQQYNSAQKAFDAGKMEQEDFDLVENQYNLVHELASVALPEEKSLASTSEIVSALYVAITNNLGE